MGLSAPAEISIYVCTILYSCSFNKHIHYRGTVINRAGEGEKMGEMKLCNRGEEEHTHTRRLNRIMRVKIMIASEKRNQNQLIPPFAD